jgi:hypothetical protein
MTPKAVVAAFVTQINKRCVDAMAALMAEGHCFADSLGHRVCGRKAVRAGWVGYFGFVPDYGISVDDESLGRHPVWQCASRHGQPKWSSNRPRCSQVYQ